MSIKDMEKIKKGDLILLISKEKRILTRAGAVLINELGKIEIEKIIGKFLSNFLECDNEADLKIRDVNS